MARGKRRGVRGGGGGEQLSESNGHEMFSGEMMDKGRPTLRGRQLVSGTKSVQF